MARNFFGYNINLSDIGDYEAAVRACRASQSVMHLLMVVPSNYQDNPRRFGEGINRFIADVGQPETQWVVRVYSTLEGDWSLINQSAYMRFVQRMGVGDRVFYDPPANEPSVGTPEFLRGYAEQMYALARDMRREGLTQGVGSFSVGRPREVDIRDGYGDALLRACAEFDVPMTIHEYAPLELEAGALYPYAYLDSHPDATQLRSLDPNDWRLRQGYPLIRRSDEWVLRADELGLPRPQLLFTEMICDRIGDVPGEVQDSLNAKYGLPEYENNLRGINAWERWATERGYADYDAFLGDHLIHAGRHVYNAPHHVAGMLFTLSGSELWTRAGHNYNEPKRQPFREQQMPRVARALATRPPSTPQFPFPPEPEEAPESWERGTMVKNHEGERTYFRDQPAGIIVGSVTSTPLAVQYCTDPAYAVNRNGEVWQAVLLEDDSAVWVARRWVEFTVVNSTPDPQPDPQPDPPPAEGCMERIRAALSVLGMVMVLALLLVGCGEPVDSATPDPTPTREVAPPLPTLIPSATP